MSRHNFPLRSLSAALVFFTALTAPALAVDVTIPAGPLSGPQSYGAVDIFHSSASLTSNSFGFYFSGDVGSATNAGDIDAAVGIGVQLDGVVGSLTNNGSITGTTGVLALLGGGDVFNAGTIIGRSGHGLYSRGALTSVTNDSSGRISSYGNALYVTGNVTGAIVNRGMLESAHGDGLAVEGTAGSFFNSGTISSLGGRGVYISGSVTGSFINSGTITAAGAAGVEFDDTVGTFTNIGTIGGDIDHGVAFWDDVGSFENAGRINAVNDHAVYFDKDVTNFTNYQGGELSGADYGVWVDNGSVTSFTNAGIIKGKERGVSISDDVGSFTNSGTLTGVEQEAVFIGGDVGTFTNAAGGVILGVDDGVVINGHVESFTNRGRIASLDGNGAGVYFDTTVGSFANGGTIESTYGYGVYVGTSVGTFVNEASGTIRGINSAVWLSEGGAGAIENRGTLTGNVGLTFGGYGTTAATVINSGTIEGTSGKAIDFGTGGLALDDTLQLRTGSRILGSVEFANGTDTLDVSGFRGNAILTVANLETVVTGSALVSDQRDGSGDGTVSIVDATGITSSGSASLGEVAGAIGGEIAGALGGITGGAGPSEPLGYAPSRPVGAAEAAADELVTTAEPTGPEVWGKVFGGIANKTNDYNAVLGGIIAGSHVAVDANTRLGGVVSVSGSRFATVGGGQTVTGTIGAAGLYGSTDLGGVVVSYSVLGGVAANHSDRTVTAAVTETARADFASWFWSPELGLSIPVPLLEGVDTAAGFRLRYVGGGVGSYTETGSSQNLSVGTASVSLLDARVELTGKASIGANDFGDVMLHATAGLLAQHNFGSSVAIAGFPLATTPASFAYGAYGDITLEAPIGPTSKASAATGLELRSDGLTSASANLGVSATF